jgi:hypothetical protein
MSTTETKIKPATGKSTIMYEVDDSKGDYTHANQFYDFIRSLGFDAPDRERGMSNNINIDGESFYVDFDKTSIMAKNGWTRDMNPRKDRCIEILEQISGGLVVKIKFNEEIDRDKLVAKIQKAIDARKAWAQEITDRKNHEMKMLTIMRDHYYADRVISAYVESIMTHEGKISFHINGASITVDALSGLPVDFTPYEKRDGVIKVANIVKWACEKKDIADKASKVCEHIVKTGSIGKEFAEYAKTAYTRYVRKDKIEER